VGLGVLQGYGEYVRMTGVMPLLATYPRGHEVLAHTRSRRLQSLESPTSVWSPNTVIGPWRDQSRNYRAGLASSLCGRKRASRGARGQRSPGELRPGSARGVGCPHSVPGFAVGPRGSRWQLTRCRRGMAPARRCGALGGCIATNRPLPARRGLRGRRSLLRPTQARPQPTANRR